MTYAMIFTEIIFIVNELNVETWVCLIVLLIEKCLLFISLIS